jgi:regulator of protease activity HflC (stomatin/prohibitin superfamily)
MDTFSMRQYANEKIHAARKQADAARLVQEASKERTARTVHSLALDKHLGNLLKTVTLAAIHTKATVQTRCTRANSYRR